MINFISQARFSPVVKMNLEPSISKVMAWLGTLFGPWIYWGVAGFNLSAESTKENVAQHQKWIIRLEKHQVDLVLQSCFLFSLH
jgi:hypothetical protein